MVTKWMKQLAVPSALAITACSLQAQAQEVPAEEAKVEIVVEENAAPAAGIIQRLSDVVQAQAAEATDVVNQVAEDEAKLSKLWLGLACEPVSDVLKAQLNIQKGLWVRDVFADGPAANAEVQSFDILLKFNDEELEDVNQLVAQVEKNGEQVVAFKILRGGKEQVLKVTPAVRPVNLVLKPKTTSAPETETLQKITAVLKQAEADGKKLDLVIVRPGIAFPADRVKPVALPKDATIKIDKQGDKPAEITIKLGDKSWTVTEDKLDQLPPEVRVLVEQMHGGATIRWQQAAPGGKDAGRALIYAPGAAGTVTMRTMPLPPHATPSSPPQVFLDPSVAARVAIGSAGIPLPHTQLDDVNRKLDAILVHIKESSQVDKLQAEVEKLRKEVEDLRSQKN